jgi:hypothetical protein
MIERGWIDEDGNVLNPEGFKTPQQGAATQVWAATSPQPDGLGGVHLEDCDIAEPAPEDEERLGVKGWAIDPEQAARLWELSAELTVGVPRTAHAWMASPPYPAARGWLRPVAPCPAGGPSAASPA